MLEYRKKLALSDFWLSIVLSSSAFAGSEFHVVHRGPPNSTQGTYGGKLARCHVTNPRQSAPSTRSLPVSIKIYKTRDKRTYQLENQRNSSKTKRLSLFLSIYDFADFFFLPLSKSERYVILSSLISAFSWFLLPCIVFTGLIPWNLFFPWFLRRSRVSVSYFLRYVRGTWCSCY